MSSQELKTATDDDLKIEIQRLLEVAKGLIHKWTMEVNECEHQVNEYNGELGLLKRDGEFTLSSCSL